MLLFQAKCIKHMETFTQRCISRWSITLCARYSDTSQKKSKLAPLQVDPQLFFLPHPLNAHEKDMMSFILNFWPLRGGYGWFCRRDEWWTSVRYLQKQVTEVMVAPACAREDLMVCMSLYH